MLLISSTPIPKPANLAHNTITMITDKENASAAQLDLPLILLNTSVSAQLKLLTLTLRDNASTVILQPSGMPILVSALLAMEDKLSTQLP